MTPDQVDGAAREAEAAFRDLAPLFPTVHFPERIIVRLDARFRGATGYAAPGGLSGKGTHDVIGLRYTELPVLGLNPDFLFRHELTHLFTGRWVDGKPDRSLSGCPLGEGIADLAAGGRNRLGLPLSFSKYLEDRGDGWAPPLRLFLHPPGGAPPRPRNGRLDYDRVYAWRIERYVEPSLFLAYVQSRIGWDGMRGFYIDYARAASSRTPGDDLVPVFRRHFGRTPEEFMDDWEAAIRKAPDDAAANRQRWLSERVYSAVQWYDFLTLGRVIPAAAGPKIESDFRVLNAEVAAGHLDAVEARLPEILDAIERASTQAALAL